jgi:hypothetical protein
MLIQVESWSKPSRTLIGTRSALTSSTQGKSVHVTHASPVASQSTRVVRIKWSIVKRVRGPLRSNELRFNQCRQSQHMWKIAQEILPSIEQKRRETRVDRALDVIFQVVTDAEYTITG